MSETIKKLIANNDELVLYMPNEFNGGFSFQYGTKASDDSGDAGAGTIVFECSNDRVQWYSMELEQPPGSLTTVTQLTAAGIAVGDFRTKYVRARGTSNPNVRVIGRIAFG